MFIKSLSHSKMNRKYVEQQSNQKIFKSILLIYC